MLLPGADGRFHPDRIAGVDLVALNQTRGHQFHLQAPRNGLDVETDGRTTPCRAPFE